MKYDLTAIAQSIRDQALRHPPLQYYSCVLAWLQLPGALVYDNLRYLNLTHSLSPGLLAQKNVHCQDSQPSRSLPVKEVTRNDYNLWAQIWLNCHYFS